MPYVDCHTCHPSLNADSQPPSPPLPHGPPPADLECCLNMTCHLVPRIPAPAAAGAASRLAAALASSTEARPDKRLLALVTLYNAAYDPASKAAVLLEALRYARAANLADIMLPVIRAHADGWARELGLDAAGERALYAASADTLAGVSRKPRTAAREAYRLLCKCLATYEVRARAGCVRGRGGAAPWAARGRGRVRSGVLATATGEVPVIGACHMVHLAWGTALGSLQIPIGASVGQQSSFPRRPSAELAVVTQPELAEAAISRQAGSWVQARGRPAGPVRSLRLYQQATSAVGWGAGASSNALELWHPCPSCSLFSCCSISRRVLHSLPTKPACTAPPARPQDADAADLPGAVPAAAQVVAEFIRSPDSFQFDLAGNPAVAQLAGSPQHGALHRLLTIFLTGTIQVRLGAVLALGMVARWQGEGRRCAGALRAVHAGLRGASTVAVPVDVPTRGRVKPGTFSLKLLLQQRQAGMCMWRLALTPR